MTFGQLFTSMNPNVIAVENGTCMWLYDGVNYHTMGMEWWNKEIPAEALSMLKAQGWISVKDRLPDDYSDCIVFDGEYVEPAVYYSSSGFYTPDCYEANKIKGVTHWMPLPEPPRKDT